MGLRGAEESLLAGLVRVEAFSLHIIDAANAGRVRLVWQDRAPIHRIGDDGERKIVAINEGDIIEALVFVAWEIELRQG